MWKKGQTWLFSSDSWHRLSRFDIHWLNFCEILLYPSLSSSSNLHILTWFASIDCGSTPGRQAESLGTMTPILIFPLCITHPSKKQATSTNCFNSERSRALRNFWKAVLMLISFVERSSRSFTSSLCVVVIQSSIFSALLPHFAFDDSSKGVPRKTIPIVLSTRLLLAMSVPLCLDSALAHTRPPKLCETKIIGRSA